MLETTEPKIANSRRTAGLWTTNKLQQGWSAITSLQNKGLANRKYGLRLE